MKVAVRNAIAAVGLGAALVTVPNAFAHGGNKDIRVGPGTESINVIGHDLVRLTNDKGQSATWLVDERDLAVDLSKVTPAGFLGGKRIMAYIQPCQSEASD